MNKYIDVIKTGLQNAYTSQSSFEPINEKTVIKLIATVDVAMQYLKDFYKTAFNEAVNLIRHEAKNNNDILNMLANLMEMIDTENGVKPDE